MKNSVGRTLWQQEGGAVAATYALSLFGLLAAAGIGFDYARLAGMDSELQNAADQAALAAASQLDGNAGACARAASAATSLVSNQTLLAEGDNAVTIQNEPACDAAGEIRFWQDKEKSTASTSDSNANFVEVGVDARAVDYALLPVTGLLRSDAIQGIAMAGLGSALCKVPPVMMCNPAEATDPNFNVNAYIGRGFRLIANDGGGSVGPGNFGYLETDSGTGAIATARILGREDIPGDCIATDDVTTKPGAQISVLDALNTRFGIYANGLNDVCGADGSLCPPSSNGRQDLVKGPGNNCGTNGNGFQIGPAPYRPASATTLTNAQADALDPMGYPRDLCHAIGVVGNCTLGNIGSGVWDRNAYWRTNRHIYPGLAPTSAELASMASFGDPATPTSAEPTRYQTYRHEAATPGKLASASASTGNTTAQGAPLCNAPGIAPGGAVPDRRVLSIAVVNCNAEGIVGRTTGVDVIEFVDAFLVEPIQRRGNGGNIVTENSDVYVEIIGNTSLGGGANAGQEIRRDVPYLIE